MILSKDLSTFMSFFFFLIRCRNTVQILTIKLLLIFMLVYEATMEQGRRQQ